MRRAACLVGSFLLAAFWTGACDLSSAGAGGQPTATVWRFSCEPHAYVVEFSPRSRSEVVRGGPFIPPSSVALYAETELGNDRSGLLHVADAEAGGSSGVPLGPPCSEVASSHAKYTPHPSGLARSETGSTLTCKAKSTPTFEVWTTPPNETGLAMSVGKRRLLEATIEEQATSPSNVRFDKNACKASAGFDISCTRGSPLCSRVEKS